MFTVAQRELIRDDLVRAANQDPRVTAAALVGSAAVDRQDEWSDIDLALRIRPDLEPEPVARPWRERMYDDHGAVHHLDWWVGPALYRIFLLPNILQIDLSFWPSKDFAASGPKFRLLFGDANDAPAPNPPGPLVGMGWLYARAAGSSLARGRRWQAVHMIDGLREQVVSLACVRFGLPPPPGPRRRRPAPRGDRPPRRRAAGLPGPGRSPSGFRERGPPAPQGGAARRRPTRRPCIVPDRRTDALRCRPAATPARLAKPSPRRSIHSTS